MKPSWERKISLKPSYRINSCQQGINHRKLSTLKWLEQFRQSWPRFYQFFSTLILEAISSCDHSSVAETRAFFRRRNYRIASNPKEIKMQHRVFRDQNSFLFVGRISIIFRWHWIVIIKLITDCRNLLGAIDISRLTIAFMSKTYNGGTSCYTWKHFYAQAISDSKHLKSKSSSSRKIKNVLRAPKFDTEMLTFSLSCHI